MDSANYIKSDTKEVVLLLFSKAEKRIVSHLIILRIVDFLCLGQSRVLLRASRATNNDLGM